MNAAKESNFKSIAVITLVSVLLFGIFYYLITDVANSTSQIKAQDSSKTEKDTPPLANTETQPEPQSNIPSQPLTDAVSAQPETAQVTDTGTTGTATNETSQETPVTMKDEATLLAAATTGDVKGDSTSVVAAEDPSVTPTPTSQMPIGGQVDPAAKQKSAFKDLSSQKVDTQPKMVLGGADKTNQTTQSTVPATGSETIFGAFVVSSLIMFTGIYLLFTQPKNSAIIKFEKRIIRDLD